MKVSDHLLKRVETNKKRIGELLLQYTSLTQDQLDEALNIQKEENLLLGEILLSKNFIHPHDITKVICHQIDIPYLTELKVDEIDPNLVMDISINYSKHSSAIRYYYCHTLPYVNKVLITTAIV